MDSKFLRYWKSIDLFGVSPVLSFQGKGKQKTFFGGFFSILMFAYICLAAIYSFQNMIFRLNPNTNITTDIGRTSGIQIGKGSINVGFTLVNTYTGDSVVDPSVIQPQFFKFLLPQVDQKTSQILSPPKLIPLNNEACTENHFNGLFSIRGFCMGIDEQPTIGTVDNAMLLVRFNKCINSTGAIECKPQSQIDAIFNNYQLLVTYPRIYIDPNDFEQPVTTKRDYFVIRSSATLSKQVRISLEEVDFETDTGFIINESNVESYINIDRIWADMTDDGKSELTAIVYMNGRKQIYKRSYMKIQQALAGTISLIRVAFLLCAIFVVPCTKVKYYTDLIHEIFSFSGPKSYAKSSSLKKIQPSFEFKNNSDFARQNQSDNPDTSSYNIIKLRSESKNYSSTPPKKNSSDDTSLINNGSLNSSIAVKEILTKSRKISAIQLEASMVNQTQIKMVAQDQLEEGSAIPQNTQELTQKGELNKENEEVQIEKKVSSDQNSPSELITPKIKGDSEQNQQSQISNDKNKRAEIVQESLDNSPIKLLKLNSQNDIQDIESLSPIKFKQKDSKSQAFEKLTTSMQKSKGRKTNQNLAVLEWIKNSIPGMNKQFKTRYKAGKDKIQNELCVTRIMKKMRELDRLKVLLLDEQQRVLFDNLPKPDILSPQDIPNAIEREGQNRGSNLTQFEIEDKLQATYEELMNRPIKNRIDVQILEWYQTGQY